MELMGLWIAQLYMKIEVRAELSPQGGAYAVQRSNISEIMNQLLEEMGGVRPEFPHNPVGLRKLEANAHRTIAKLLGNESELNRSAGLMREEKKKIGVWAVSKIKSAASHNFRGLDVIFEKSQEKWNGLGLRIE